MIFHIKSLQYTTQWYMLMRWELRVFKSKIFNKWAQKVGITDNHLRCVLLEIQHGLISARLGGNLIKQRMA